MDAWSALEALQADTSRGASEIAADARRLLAQLPDQHPSPEQAARQGVLDLVRAHPAMAPVVHLAHETLTLLDEEGPSALQTVDRPREPGESIAEYAAGWIEEADEVATYSRSGTVLRALQTALEAPGELTVRTSKARPGDEGVDVARRLADAGASIELTFDAHLLATVDQADLVLVGADAIAAEAFVNKTGTRVLLEQAEGHAARLVLAARDKLWPSSLPPPPSSQAPWELEADVPDTVQRRVPLFERIPIELADRIVTDQGAREPRELAREAEGIDVHPDVVDALA